MGVIGPKYTTVFYLIWCCAVVSLSLGCKRGWIILSKLRKEVFKLNFKCSGKTETTPASLPMLASIATYLGFSFSLRCEDNKSTVVGCDEGKVEPTLGRGSAQRVFHIRACYYRSEINMVRLLHCDFFSFNSLAIKLLHYKIFSLPTWNAGLKHKFWRTK